MGVGFDVGVCVCAQRASILSGAELGAAPKVAADLALAQAQAASWCPAEGGGTAWVD
jgi:hypothetical protein